MAFQRDISRYYRSFNKLDHFKQHDKIYLKTKQDNFFFQDRGSQLFEGNF